MKARLDPAAAPLLAALALLVAGCAMKAPDGAPAVPGTRPGAVLEGVATYRERIALPPGAEFEALIEDVSLADAAATVVARTRITPAGQVPIRFRIEYDPARIVAGMRYGVRARISVDGQLRFTTDSHYPAFVDGKPQTHELVMRGVGPAAQ
jgi:putative lipoprotein